MKKLTILVVGAVCASAFLATPGYSSSHNEREGWYAATPVDQQTGPTRPALQNYGLLASDGTTTATATGTGGTSTVTLSKVQGTITTDAITTAAGATHVMTVTNTLVTSSSVITYSLNINGSAGWPIVLSIEPGSGSFVVRILNAHASAAVNAALKFSFVVGK